MASACREWLIDSPQKFLTTKDAESERHWRSQWHPSAIRSASQVNRADEERKLNLGDVEPCETDEEGGHDFDETRLSGGPVVLKAV